MAAKNSKDLNAIYQSILSGAKEAAISAAKETAKKVAKDMHNEALRGLKKYYDSYNPDMYERTYYLKNAIIPTYKDTSTDKVISIEIGIRYDENKLIDHYYSNSQYHKSGDKWISRNDPEFNWDRNSEGKPIGDNGIPDPEWILNNFLHGIHPRMASGFVYAPVHSQVSQIEIMNNFIDNKAENLMEKYLESAMLNELTKRIK